MHATPAKSLVKAVRAFNGSYTQGIGMLKRYLEIVRLAEAGIAVLSPLQQKSRDGAAALRTVPREARPRC
jgi:hypothetical protein